VQFRSNNSTLFTLIELATLLVLVLIAELFLPLAGTGPRRGNRGAEPMLPAGEAA